MITVAMRVVPNAGVVKFAEFADLAALLSSVEVRIKEGILGDVEASFYLKEGRARALLYVERLSAPASALAATKPQRGSPCGVNVDPVTGRVRQAGTGGHYDWLMIEPSNHPEYSSNFDEFKKARKQRAILQAKLEEEESIHRSEILDLANSIGYEKALALLRDMV